ncbi:MAG: SO_0444 family Cu/Zn efflux transporter [bacterium]|nr:SO_0444 family Cu/Zn efflux transporter [bacterium]
MTLLTLIVVESWEMLLSASGFILLGLFVAGFVHVLLPGSLVARWMGRRGLSGAALAALIGVPLPICSCGVVPLAMELRRKGASREATLAFLITTPESSLDSILLTWGLMGPLMAIIRPIAAFLTAILAAVLAIVDGRGDTGETIVSGCESNSSCVSDCGDQGSAVPQFDRTEEALAELARVWRSLLRGLGIRPEIGEGEVGEKRRGSLVDLLLRPAIRYAATDLLDHVVFWLVLGIVMAGIIGALVPADLAGTGLGSGVLPMLLLVVAGVPLYLCASASTPVAAALLFKGFSPGAALVFLLTGPATNISTLLMLTRVFGRRFVALYLVSIVGAAVACGLALDAVLSWVGWSIAASVGGEARASIQFIEIVFAILFLVLAAWRLSAGAFRTGVRDLRGSIVSGLEFLGLLRIAGSIRKWNRRSLMLVLIGAVTMYLCSGLTVVHPESKGYEIVFERIVVEDAEPGLHWTWPWPFGRMEVHPTELVRKADVGFRTDLDLLKQRRFLTLTAKPQDWHSQVSAMNVVPAEASYVTGDENLVDMSFSVHYEAAYPAAFFYSVEKPDEMVHLFAQAAAREVVASLDLDGLLTEKRSTVETRIENMLQEHLDDIGIGVDVASIHIVDVHPPAEAVFAFRNVSSAREDRATRIHQARDREASTLPLARGSAARIEAAAQGEADRKTRGAEGGAIAFSAKVGSFARAKDVLRHQLWLEVFERSMVGKKKLILPPGTHEGGFSVWQSMPPSEPSSGEE